MRNHRFASAALALIAGVGGVAWITAPRRTSDGEPRSVSSPAAEDALDAPAPVTAPARRTSSHEARELASSGAAPTAEPATKMQSRALEVLVLHADGSRAADVPVVLEGRCLDEPSVVFDLGRAASGANGEPGVLRADPERLAKLSRSARPAIFWIEAEVPIAEPPRLELAPRTIEEGGTQRLVLPPVGSISVAIESPRGTAYTLPAIAHLFVRRGGDGDRWPPAARHCETASGSVRFTCVGLGLETRVVVEPAATGLRAAAVERMGPLHAGEEVAVAIILGERWPIARVRIVDETLRPLAQRQVSTALRNEPRSSTPAGLEPAPEIARWTTTNDAGEIRFTVELPLQSSFRRVARFALDVPAGLAVSPQASRRGELSLEQELVNGAVSDLGDVVLREDPLLVGGVVLREDGEPVRDAWISIAPATRANDLLLPPRKATNAAGRFAIFGSFEGTLIVKANHPRSPGAQALGVRPGTSDLVLLLGVGGDLSGRVLVDPDVPLDALHAKVRGKFGFRDQGLADRDGAFHFEGLPLVPTALEIGAADWAIARFDAVPVDRDGSGMRDARLQAIDLRGKLRTTRLRVLRADGASFTGGAVRVVDRAGRGVLTNADSEGRLAVVHPADIAALAVVVEGFERFELAPASHELEVRLAAR